MTKYRSRCAMCNAVIARSDSECYVCGEPVPGFKRSWFWAKPTEDKTLIDRVKGHDFGQATATGRPEFNR
jgi:hypothetical protein